ncbi:MAG TPA: MFS transporter [Sphingopyxis sp.]|nr:MFS transporter [Sphingopyxis sp.]
MTIGAETPQEQGLEARRIASTFRVLAVVQSTLIFTIALIMIPLPAIAVEFGLGVADVLLLQIAYGLPFSGLLLFGGRLADRFGGRPMFLASLAAFGAASLGAAVASDFHLLVGMRFIQGAAAALAAPAAMAILRLLFRDQADYSRAMATWGGVSVLGAVVGFVTSGILITWLSWRWMFAVPVVVSLFGILAISRLTRGAGHHEPVRPGLDPGGALLATAGIVASSVGFIASHSYHWGSVAVIGPLGAGLALLAVFLFAETKVRDPLLPPSFLCSSRRAVGLVGMLFAAAGSLLIEFVLLFYLQTAKGWSPLATSLAFLPFVGCILLSNGLAARLTMRIGAARVIAAGSATGACGLLLLALLDRETTYLAVLLPAQILLAVGLSLLFSGSAVMATSNVADNEGGLAGGVLNTAMELGPTIGFSALMAIAATQSDAIRGYAWAFGAAGIGYLCLAAMAGAMASRRFGQP